MGINLFSSTYQCPYLVESSMVARISPMFFTSRYIIFDLFLEDYCQEFKDGAFVAFVLLVLLGSYTSIS